MGQIQRRRFVLQASALLAAPFAAGAQQAGKIPRLCYIGFGVSVTRFSAFFDGLRDLGYVDGQTININYLSADGRAERYPALAAECVHRKADIIATSTTPATQAAKQATSSIPIVMMALGDPVGSGLVESLARPGGNVTGMSFMAPVLAAKRLEMLKEVAPRISRVLLLASYADPIAARQVDELKKAAISLGVTLQIHDIRTADDLPAAFDAGARERAEGLLTTAESIFQVHRPRVIELAARHRLPAVHTQRSFPDTGGLMAYSADFRSLYAGAAAYVDKILKGAKPADLPVVQSTKFELVINMKTARTLGLKIPQTLLVRADEVIQ